MQFRASIPPQLFFFLFFLSNPKDAFCINLFQTARQIVSWITSCMDVKQICVFMVWALPRFKHQFQKQIQLKVIYCYYLKEKISLSINIKFFQKIVFSKSDLMGSWFFCNTFKFFKSQYLLKIWLNFNG